MLAPMKTLTYSKSCSESCVGISVLAFRLCYWSKFSSVHPHGMQQKKENPPKVHCRSSAAFRTIFRITGCFGKIVKAISGYQKAGTNSLKRASLRFLRIKIFQRTQLNNLKPSALLQKILIRF
jgi:hypothetical protein